MSQPLSEEDLATERLIAQLIAEDFAEQPIGSSIEDYEEPLSSVEVRQLEGLTDDEPEWEPSDNGSNGGAPLWDPVDDSWPECSAGANTIEENETLSERQVEAQVSEKKCLEKDQSDKAASSNTSLFEDQDQLSKAPRDALQRRSPPTCDSSEGSQNNSAPELLSLPPAASLHGQFNRNATKSEIKSAKNNARPDKPENRTDALRTMWVSDESDSDAAGYKEIKNSSHPDANTDPFTVDNLLPNAWVSHEIDASPAKNKGKAPASSIETGTLPNEEEREGRPRKCKSASKRALHSLNAAIGKVADISRDLRPRAYESFMSNRRKAKLKTGPSSDHHIQRGVSAWSEFANDSTDAFSSTTTDADGSVIPFIRIPWPKQREKDEWADRQEEKMVAEVKVENWETLDSILRELYLKDEEKEKEKQNVFERMNEKMTSGSQIGC